MKKLVLTAVSLVLASVSLSSFADKVTLTGQPVVLEQREGVYYYPGTYNTANTYNYVVLGSSNSVCYSEAQSALSSLTPQVISIMVDGKSVQWTCYPYDENYFTVTQ